MKLKLSFYEFIGARLGIPGPKIPPSQASSGQPPHKSNVARPGICPVCALTSPETWLNLRAMESGFFIG
jgi:hypothetical protein